jgi:type IV pilus biogenesis protein CpaD/CtpE
MLSGCQNVVQEHLSDDFGNAVRANIAVQTLNPDAGGPDDSASLDGQRVEQAVQRMRSRSNEVQNTSLIQGVGSN